MNIEFATVEYSNDLFKILVAASEELRGVDFNEEGWSRFMGANAPEDFAAKIGSAEYTILVCTELGQIVGYISMQGNEKIDQLFVLPEARKKGVSSALWCEAKKRALERGSNGNFWVRSSRYAVPVCQKFGFSKEGELQNVGGISFQLMRLN